MTNADVILYYHITPNIDGGIYDFPNRKHEPFSDSWGLYYSQHLKNRLKKKYADDNDRYASLRLRSFNVEDGFIDIPLDELSYVNAYPQKCNWITYVAILPNDKGAAQFYHVTNRKFLPGRLRLLLDRDYWAENIGYATLSNVTVYKTTRAPNKNSIDMYWTDENLMYNSSKQTSINLISNAPKLTPSDLRLYAVITHTQTQSATVRVDTIQLYSFNPREILGLNRDPNYTEFHNVVELIANIYAKNLGGTKEGEATVSKLFIFDKNIEYYAYGGLLTTNFKTVDQSGQKTDITCKRVITSTYDYEFKLVNGPVNTTKFGNQSQLNKLQAVGLPITLGVADYGMVLPTWVGLLTARININAYKDNVIIKVLCNNTEMDITSAFEITAVTNNGTLNKQEVIAKSISTIANVASGIFQISAGGAGIVSGTAAIADTLVNGKNTNKGAGNKIPGGNGLLTMKSIINLETDGFWVCNIYGEDPISIIEHRENVANILQSGVYCNSTIPNYFLDYEPSGTTATELRWDFFRYYVAEDYLFTILPSDNEYIQADLTVRGVAIEAAEVIRSNFANGIAYKFIIDY